MDFRNQYPLPGTDRPQYPAYEPYFTALPVAAPSAPSAPSAPMDFTTGFHTNNHSYTQQQPLVRPTTHVTSSAVLGPQGCTLNVRQQPKEALVVLKGKEKFRKPLDPPPILQLSVNQYADPQRNYLHNPYIFASVSLFKADVDEPIAAGHSTTMTGTLVSSLHRLKDSVGEDGAYFVFGDISIKVQGNYRLRFNVYEIQGRTYQHIASTTSEVFHVVPQKDFKGLLESTYLSRTFSDQGVRLRLRKESRGMNNKRANSEEQQEAPGKRPMTNYTPNPYDYMMMPQPPYSSHFQ